MWSMVSTSTTACPKEEIPIAVAAGKCGRKDIDVDASETRGEHRKIVAHRLMDGRVANDALLDGAARRLELRLDQRQQSARCSCKFERDGQHMLQRDEADV